MWIEIADDVPANHPAPSLDLCAVLEKIALASFDGNHVLYASRATLQWFLQLEIGAASKAAVRRALNTVAERGAYRDSVLSRLVITPSGSAIERDDFGHWQAPIDLLVGINLQAAELLAEDVSDAEAFEFAAKHFKKANRRNGFGISLTHSHGGGSQIQTCFKSAISNKTRFTLRNVSVTLHHR
jgi:hypothetical protein